MAGKNALQQVEQEVFSGSVEEVVIGGSAAISNMDELDNMFKELEAGLPTESIKLNGLAEVPATEKQMLDAGHAVNTEELRTAALKELDEQSQPTPDEAKTPAPAAAKRAAPVTKRISTLGMAKSVALATALGDKLDDLLTIDEKDKALTDDERFDKRIALLETIDNMPKKIGEKAANLFAHVSRGAALSNYTRIAVNFLFSNDELTSKQLKDVYMTRYSEGTASSQTTQMMNLLPALGIAIKSGGRLIPNPTSTLLPVLTALNQPGPTVGKVEDEEDAE